MKRGSKYYPLFEYLKSCDQETIKLTFDQIADLMGCELPVSALKKKNWWSNRDSASALQAKAWISASYQIHTVDLSKRFITLRKFTAKYNIKQQDGKITWRKDAIKALRKHMGLTQAQFAQELGVRRQTVSEWENGTYDPNRSTTKFLELVAKQSDFQRSSSDK